MHGYELEGWTDFFLAGAGAAAALTGLVFVALSINLTKILSAEGLPARAARTIMLLSLGLVASLVALIPQSTDALAIELGVLGLLVGVIVAVSSFRYLGSRHRTRGQTFMQLSLDLGGPLLLLIGSVSLWSGGGGGLYWIAAAVALLLLDGIENAWVLLVEILR